MKKLNNNSDEFVGVNSAIRCEVSKVRLAVDIMAGAENLDIALEYYSKLCKSISNIFELKKSELWLKKLVDVVEGD